MICVSNKFIKNGIENKVFTLSNSLGLEVDILDYGARIISIRLKNAQSQVKEFVLGPKNAQDYYLPQFAYNGATVGRYANRIGEAKFSIGDKEYRLSANQNGHCLHGGKNAGFHDKVWKASIEDDALVLEFVSLDGADGFPGELKAKVKYFLTKENELKIEYSAESDKDTHCSLTNHSYFTFEKRDAREFFACINANTTTKFDKDFVARGEFCDITNTAYSFNPEKKIGQDIDADDYFIKQRSGYDVNYCVNKQSANAVDFCASVRDEVSKMKIECYSTLPGLQFYVTKNTGKMSEEDTGYRAFCLEPQYYPNTPNCPSYPSTLLKKGQKYFNVIVYKFFA